MRVLVALATMFVVTAAFPWSQNTRHLRDVSRRLDAAQVKPTAPLPPEEPVLPEEPEEPVLPEKDPAPQEDEEKEEALQLDGTWNQMGRTLLGEQSYSYIWPWFSRSLVSLSSQQQNGTSYLAVGAPQNHGGGNLRGHVRVYFWNGTDWGQVGLDLDGEADLDGFGFSVSLSANGSVLAAGAPYSDVTSGLDNGRVYVYRWNGAVYEPMGNAMDGERAFDHFGASVSLSAAGERLAVAAPDSDEGPYDGGVVQVYEWNSTDWRQLGQKITGEGYMDYSGTSLSLAPSGDVLAIGAQHHDGALGWDYGQVRIYKLDDTSGTPVWEQMGDDIHGELPLDLFGSSVSLTTNGTKVAIGAPGGEGSGFTNNGYVRVFDFDEDMWTQAGDYLRGEDYNDNFGFSVSLSADDGSRVAVGGPRHDGVNIDDHGHVRVYEWDGVNASWYQVGNDMEGEQEDDLSGGTVSLDSNGSRVAVLAPFADGNGNSSGSVRVYEFVPSAENE